MTNKLNQLIPFIKEKKQQEFFERLTEASKLYDSLKAEYRQTKEKKIVDMMVGNKPIIQYIQSLECKKKGNGELCLGEKDWSAIIDALRKSMPQQEIPQEMVSKTKVIALSSDINEERKIKLLEQIVKLLNVIEEVYIVLVYLLSQEKKTNIIQSNN